MKKRIIIISSVLISILLVDGGYFVFLNKNDDSQDINNKGYVNPSDAVIKVEYIDKLEVEFDSAIKVSDFIKSINGEVVDDYKINTRELGNKDIEFYYINDDGIKIKQNFTINIVDKTAPMVWLGGSYSVTEGSDVDLTKKIMCGDNVDNTPKCEIVGDYDMSKAGTYPLTFRATDNSNNITEKKFNLYVNKPKNNGGGNNNYPGTRTYFSDVISKYKNSKTEIGLDISEWQGDVDFEKLKKAGVEFVILRVGSTRGITGEYFLDKKFEQNIKMANEVGIPVGIYFYSYANSREKAIEDARWVLDKIKDYKVDLPIAFDWENWSFYNEFNLSFFGLTDMAEGFLDVFKEAGYEGMLYSSATFLLRVWLKTEYPVWMAHYTNNIALTDYKGDYDYWQLCSDGRIDGINGDVDINVRYKK